MQNIQALRTTLCDKIAEIQKIVENEFQNLDFQALNYKETPQKWSIAECLEHLNRYHAYYNPEIRRGIEQQKPLQKPDFQSNWLGKYCINMVKDNSKKQKTMKHLNPVHSQIDENVVAIFLQNQVELLHLTKKSTQVDWTKTKVKIEFAKFLNLRLGDALQFVIYHQERHIQQAIKVHTIYNSLPQNNNLII